MSNSLEKAKQMVRTSRETGKLLQIGHQRRSNPRYQQVYNNLLGRAKLFGQVTAVNAQWNRSVSKSKELGCTERNKIDQATLEKYGYENMQQFRNWRWYKKYGGGPISDLGAHQIDIFNWFLKGNPISVMAGGGTDYFKQYEWEDNVMAIYEFMTPTGIVRALYQVQTTTSAGGGYFEYFMGTEGSIKMSESPKITRIFREACAPSWNEWIAKNWIENFDPTKKIKPWQLPKPTGTVISDTDDGKVDLRESAVLDEFQLTVELNKPIHQPHLENFFGAVRGQNKLNCPGEVALASAGTVLAVHDAVRAGKKIPLDESQFKA
jgi:predicted dehydrogenase